MAETREFPDSRSLKEAVHAEFGRTLTNAEWQQIDPDGSYSFDVSYGEADLAAIVKSARALPKLPSLSRKERERIAVREMAGVTAQRVRGQVEDLRHRLFGSRGAPFADIQSAQSWIERQARVRTLETSVYTIAVRGSRGKGTLGGLYHIRDTLQQLLPTSQPQDAGEERRVVEELLTRSDLESVGLSDPLLHYLREGSEGTFEEAQVRIPAEGQLAVLYRGISTVCKQTRWPESAVILHVLTGVTHIPIVEATYNASDEGPIVSVQVRYPRAVSPDTVAASYRAATHPLSEKRGRKRPTLTWEQAALARLVEEHPEETWEQLRQRWMDGGLSRTAKTADALRQWYGEVRRILDDI